MKKDVLISIIGTQTDIEDYVDTTKLYTDGTLQEKNGLFYIKYDETEATGFEGCKTTIKADGKDKITMLRLGACNSHLVVQKGIRSVGHYETSAGNVAIGINTKRIEQNLNADGGELRFKYDVDINSEFLSCNEVVVKVKPI